MLSRVFELGWTSERFEEFDSNLQSSGREANKAERIGKKYQWIAYHEMLAFVADQCLERLQDALEELTPKARATFMLHRHDGLSFDEISEQLCISRPMVKKYLMKALLHLRQRLDQAD